ncbi:MAG: diguanylate cyclase [Sulfurovum sp.]|nr:diguanylate cyclase [Sulfurovum sp.]
MLFKKNSDKYTLTKWYKLFTTSTLFTASLFGLIGITAIPLDDNIGHHLMITAFLMGLSAASNTSLGKDSRLDTIYSTILIAPLVVGMMLENTQIYWLTSILILFAYGSKLLINIHSLKLQEQINKQKERINRVRQTLKEKENLMYHFTQEAPIAILSYNKNLKITDANNALLKLLKLKRQEILGLSALSVPDKRIVQTMQKSIETGSGIYQGPYRSLRNLDLWVEAICFSTKDQNKIVTGGICVIHDKTNEHNALKILEFNSKHDQLTLLQNRRGLYAEMSNILQHEKHHTHYSVLFYLDLNKFKYINDSLGHKIGDATLVAVANRLSLELPDNSVISRFGGDEFIIIAPYVVNKKALIDQPVQLFINKLKTIFAEPFMINDIKMTVQTSVGIVIIEPKDSNIEEIIRHADIAMYQAKKNRHNHISYYDIELDNERKKLFTLQHDLVFAAENRQLELYLQPIVSIDNDHVIAAECLIRWKHPEFGLLSPQDIIPTATETGAISDITWWILEEICKKIYRLKEKKDMETLIYLNQH